MQVMDLTLAEKIVLLALDDKSGKFHPLPDRALDFALAGALLTDLAMTEHISARTEAVEILSLSPCGIALLDEALKQIAAAEIKTLDNWIATLTRSGSVFRRMALDALIAKKILEEKDDLFLWVFHRHRFPACDEEAEHRVIERIRKVVTDESFAATRADNVLVGLMSICQLSHIVFGVAELERYGDRIAEITRRDCISRTVTETIQEIQRALLEIRAYSGM